MWQQLQITRDSQAEKNRQLLQLQKDLDEQRAVADKLRSSHQKAVVSWWQCCTHIAM
jgi:hypothetical protein